MTWPNLPAVGRAVACRLQWRRRRAGTHAERLSVPKGGHWANPISKEEHREGCATGDHLADDYGPPRPPEPTCGAQESIRSAAKVAAWHLINAESPVGERRLFALVDAVSCLLDQGGHHVDLETARCALETVVSPAVAVAAVRALVGYDRAV